MGLIQKIFGSKNQRELKKLQPIVDRINRARASDEAKSDAELRGKTAEFKQKLDNGATLDDILERGVRRRPRGLAAHRSACATTTCS